MMEEAIESKESGSTAQSEAASAPSEGKQPVEYASLHAVGFQHAHKDSGASAPSFHSKVTEPTNIGEGLTQFTLYQVITAFTGDGEGHTEVTVKRRYNDFVWLRTCLLKKHLGVLVPPIPEKNFSARFTGDVVNERMRGLQRFLNRLAVHPVLKDSSDVMMFLKETNQTVLQHHVEQSGEDPESEKGPGAYVQSWIAGLQQTFSQTFGDKRSQTEDDVKCDKVHEYAVKLDESLTTVHTQIEGLLKKNKGLSRAYFDFGNHCSALGEFEGKAQEPKLASVFTKLGNVADTLNILLQAKTEKEQVDFQEAVRDQLQMVRAVKHMVKSRGVALNAFHISSQELENKQAKLSAIEADPSKGAKVAALQKEIAALQVTVTEKQEDLDNITKLLFAETNRFRREKEHDFKQIVLSYIQTQIDHSKKVRKAWESILPELGDM